MIAFYLPNWKHFKDKIHRATGQLRVLHCTWQCPTRLKQLYTCMHENQFWWYSYFCTEVFRLVVASFPGSPLAQTTGRGESLGTRLGWLSEILKSAHAGAPYIVDWGPSSTKYSTCQPVANFKLFSGFDGVLVLLQEKQKVVLVWMDFKFSQPFWKLLPFTCHILSDNTMVEGCMHGYKANPLSKIEDLHA